MRTFQPHIRAILVLIAGTLIVILPFIRTTRGVRDAFGPLERPFRIAQTWNLYGSGPSVLRRFEVLVDGEVRYRAADAEHTWRKPSFTYRRVRPIVVNVCMKRSKNARPFYAWVVRKARETWPDAQKVELRCTQSKFPDGPPTEMLRIEATAPEWSARKVQ